MDPRTSKININKDRPAFHVDSKLKKAAAKAAEVLAIEEKELAGYQSSAKS